MGIVDEDVERVKAAADLAQVAGERLALRRVGRRLQGLCPFHAEKTPSFSINAELGLYHCFGCGASGDVITFVRELEGLDFAAAVEWLAGRAGITLRYTEQGESRDRQRRSRLTALVAEAAEFYHRRLLEAPDAGRARAYLRSRGYDGDVVRRFRLGWAPDGWDTLARALGGDRRRDDLVAAGLAFENRRGRLQDTFRARVMFPIVDERGDAVAFGGRSLPDGPPPKYKNSPETPLYRKSRVLYGLNWAKTDAVAVGEVIVCEGYTDVIGFAAAGVPRAVATCGTALTEDHVRLLRRFAPRVVLAYDADAAGQTGAERIYEWEQRHQLDVAVAALPPGSDPGALAAEDPERLRAAVEKAAPFLAFRVDRVLSAADLATPEHRARAAEAALEVVREHPNELVRQEYAGQVAVRCGLPAASLVGALERARGRRRVEVPTPAARRAPGPERAALLVAIHEPDALAPLDDDLRRAAPLLFTDDLHLAAFGALLAAGSVQDALSSADPAVAELLRELAVEELGEAEPGDVVDRLLQEAATRVLRRLQRDAARADDPMAWAPAIRWLKLAVESLRVPGADAGPRGQLVAWLADRAEEGA